MATFRPPKSVQEAAKRSLEMRRSLPKSRKGGTAVGVARANQLANGSAVSLDGFPSAGRIAWALWGGDAGRTWAKSILRRSERDA